ncbi:MAG: cellulose binding domain-containing protein [Saccharofermentans sp.]|nr:cellulose binding domain-containing protein [Saccharofermentans sp.]
MSFKKLFRISSVLLIAIFFVGALPWRELRADANIHGDYSCDRLSVTYDQTTAWDLNTQGEFVVTNVSEEMVEGWTLQFEFAADLTITNLWNGQDLRNETTPANVLIIGNEAYNGTIAPGQSVSFGLIMTGYEFAPVAPLNATLPVAAEPVPEEIPAEPEVIPAVDPSTCVIFAGSDVTISGWRTTIEGNVYAGNSFNFQGSELSVAGTVNSEGTVTITGYSSVVSGTQEGAAHVDMPNLSEEILSRSNELTVLDSLSDAPVNGYYYSADNISINAQTLEGEAVIVSEGDIEVNVDTISGENNITLYSVNGNITINCNQAVLSGTVYAPNGRVTLNTNEITVVGKILSNELVFNGSVLTVTNDSEDIPEITPEPTVTVEPTATVTPVPTEEPAATPTVTVTPTVAPTATPTVTVTPVPTEEPTATPTPTPVEEEEPDPTPTPEPIDETLDSDLDDIPDYLEIEIGTNPNDPDTDGDGLDDYLEIMVGYDPTIQDTNGNGILDGEEDLDNDGVCNVNELSLETDLFSDDTDEDRLKDGEELYTYGTDPKNPDTDGDGILDGDEIAIGKDPLDPSDATIRIEQTKIEEITNEEDPAITSVEVTMSLADSIESSLTIRDMYNVDFYTTAVAGRIGSPISFECAEDFDTATVVIHYSEAALGDTAESDLGILWYYEENGIFVEQEQAILDSSNNKITVELEHFSEYVLVDMSRWMSGMPTVYTPEEIGYTSAGRNSVDIQIRTSTCYMQSTYSPYSTFFVDISDEELELVREYLEEIYGYLHEGDTCHFQISGRQFRLFLLPEYAYSESGLPDEVVNNLYEPNGIDLREETPDRIDVYCEGDVVWIDLSVNPVSNQSWLSYSSGWNNIGVDGWYIFNGTGTPQLCFASLYIHNDNDAYLEELQSFLEREDYTWTDNDEDGLPDVLEREGMMGLNGQVYYSDPELQDTDGDGIIDSDEIGEMYCIRRLSQNSVEINGTIRSLTELQYYGYSFLERYIPANAGEVCFVFDVESIADDPDSDDDGLNDIEDDKKTTTNPHMNYIFYANGQVSDGPLHRIGFDINFENEANFRACWFEVHNRDYEIYNVDSIAYFIEKWDGMGFNEDGTQCIIDEVYIISHGTTHCNCNSTIDFSPNASIDNATVASLTPKRIGSLYLMCCFGAKEFDGCISLAQEFINRFQIDEVYGCDSVTVARIFMTDSDLSFAQNIENFFISWNLAYSSTFSDGNWTLRAYTSDPNANGYYRYYKENGETCVELRRQLEWYITN